jgi:hypothetical protein
MTTRLGMKGDIAGTRFGEIRDYSVHGFDHEVHVDWRRDAMLAQGFANQRTNGQVGDKMIVHDIEMNNIGTGIKHGLDVLTETSKIS